MEYRKWSRIKWAVAIALAFVVGGRNAGAQCEFGTLYNCPAQLDFIDVTMAMHVTALEQGTVGTATSIQFAPNWTTTGFFVVGFDQACLQLSGLPTPSGGPLALGVAPSFVVPPSQVQATGAMQLNFIVTSDPALAGTTLYFQAFQLHICTNCGPVQFWWNNSLVAKSTIC